MQPSGSRERQHRSRLTAQTHCAMELGGDKPSVDTPGVRQKSRYPLARDEALRKDQANQP